MAEPVPEEAFPRRDEDCAAFVRSLGLPGYVDVHVHVLPARLQRAVWDYFDRLDDPPWPIRYRDDEAARLATLRRLGVVAHTGLAYAHRPGMVGWLNDHTLSTARRHPQVVPTFTFHPEEGIDAAVADAIERGGRIAKVHLQVGRFHTTDPRLDGVWPQLVDAGVPALVHASAVYGVDGGEEFCGPDQVRRLLDRYPDLTVIVAHLGAPETDAFLDLVEEADNVYVDTAMVLTDPPYPAMDQPLDLGRLAAASSRILFGSDFPTVPHDYATQVRGLAGLGLDAPALRGVLHDHAAELLHLSNDAS